MSNQCNLCPNACNVDRQIHKGNCNSFSNVKIAKYYLHMFEEPCISGKNGSGTVFFCGCPLRCVFCQNYEVSRNTTGKEISTEELAEIFKNLEMQGAHNINLVNPTHYVDKIIDAFKIYRPNIPIVYNTHGYEKIETLEKINDYIDIYLPDLKFFSPKISQRYTGKNNYFEYASAAIKYMMQAKPTVFDGDGMMKSGVIIRHLVLPLNTDDSIKIIDFLNESISNGAYFSLMAQYTPFGEIDNYPELKRKISKREYDKVLSHLFARKNLNNCFLQELSSAKEIFIPKWDF